MNKVEPQNRLTSYGEDYALWTREQGELLRAGKRDRLDLDNLAEEIESLGISQRSEIESRLHVLLVHLLKWRFQPVNRSSGWKGTIRNQRRRLLRLLKASPSLRPYPAEVLTDEYEAARVDAAEETTLDESLFPVVCPYSIEQILDSAFWPGDR